MPFGPLVAVAVAAAAIMLANTIHTNKQMHMAKEREAERARERESEWQRERANETRQTRLKSTHSQCGLWSFIRSVDRTHTRTHTHTRTQTATHTHTHIYNCMQSAPTALRADWAVLGVGCCKLTCRPTRGEKGRRGEWDTARFIFAILGHRFYTCHG